MAKGLADTICYCRTRREIMQYFRQWESIIDGFALANMDFFRDTQGAFRKLFRKFMGVASTSVDLTTNYYKEFVADLKIIYLEPIQNEGPAAMRPDNPFRFLIDVVLRVLKKDTKDAYSQVIHIMSTRHLSTADELTEQKASVEFERLVTSKFEVKATVLANLRVGIRRVLKICASLRGGTRNVLGPHLSISRSGSYGYSQKNGGKAAETLLALNEILNEVPDSDEMCSESCPAGPIRFFAGLCRWQSIAIFAGEKDIPDTLAIKWMTPMEKTIVDRPPPLYGMGPSTGLMTYYTAWRCMIIAIEKEPPLVRQETVREPGGKARIITASSWWLPILQQPYVHGIGEILAYHPSAHSVFKRQDQAWQALKNFQKLRIAKLPLGYAVLSSDFKSATDSIPFEVQKVCLEELNEQFGTKRSAFLEDLIGTRIILNEKRMRLFKSTRGILMGEPLSKIILVLSILGSEEYVYSDYVRESPWRTYTKKIAPWRCFHIGGDDHIAVGPLTYLKRLTKFAKSIGFIVSPSKHIMSRTAVTYTEKMLYFKGKILNLPIGEVNRRIDESIFVDSIKTRLLSPFVKALESRDDRNSAIGKAKSLSRSIQWFPLGGRLEKTARYAVERFRARFRTFIPASGRRMMTALTKLAPSLGGLGLGFRTQATELNALPKIFRWAIFRISEQSSYSYRLRNALSSTFQNPKSYGTFKYVTDFIDQLDTYPNMVGTKFQDLRDRYVDEAKDLDNVEFIDFLKEKSIISFTDFKAMLERPYRFQLLLTTSESDHFNTQPNGKRFARTWNKLKEIATECDKDLTFERPDPEAFVLTPEILWKAERYARWDWFIELNQGATAAYMDVKDVPDGGLSEDQYFKLMLEGGLEFREDVPYRDHILYNAPELRIPRRLGPVKDRLD